MTIAVGSKVRVRHIGVEKVGVVTKVTPTFVWAEVPLVSKGTRKVVKFERLFVKEI